MLRDFQISEPHTLLNSVTPSIVCKNLVSDAYDVLVIMMFQFVQLIGYITFINACSFNIIARTNML